MPVNVFCPECGESVEAEYIRGILTISSHHNPNADEDEAVRCPGSGLAVEEAAFSPPEDG